MTSAKNSIPSWLDTPPNSKINPPTVTRKQELPFDELSWEDFEKLCLRLARLESTVEHCQLYGVKGQEQEGIDIYSRQKLEEKYSVYQCKREKEFGPAKIKSAINKFVEGEWVNKTSIFVLCTMESLASRDRAEEFEAQANILKDKGIALLAWDNQQLSIRLKEIPNLVDDFFGREWVRSFCSLSHAEKLGQRLDKNRVMEFRDKLLDFYKRMFATHDPGVPVVSSSGIPALSFEDRVIIPDIYDKRVITSQSTPGPIEPQAFKEQMSMSYEEIGSMHKERYQRPQNLSYQQRLPIEEWLIVSSRNIILGGPGSGKSTFLRFLTIDILQPVPKLSLIAQKWGEFLPIWIPFAYWTKIISNPSTANYTIGQMLKDWLSSWSEERVWPLIEQALEDERLLLLVDGIDEWTNEQAAKIALDRLLVFEQRNVPVIVASRPHGFARLGVHQAGWQIGELCEFSFGQQKQLAQLWFNYKIRSLSDATCTEGEIERKAIAETDSFLNELVKSPDFRELSKIPLLLCLLIYLKFQNVKLPQNRFKAYNQLIEHLIYTHPQRRRTVAGLTDPLSELTNDELKIAFSNLSFHIQNDYGSGVIDQKDAQKIVEDYLKDVDQGLGLELSNARKLSKIILDIGEQTIGLIVKKSQNELGFFHRAFQEYLVAIYLSVLSLDEQLKVVEGHCSNPQWREVILSLLHVNNRKEDIKLFVDKMKLKTVNKIDQYNINLLLSEIAFGESNCSVTLARELANEAFEKIETEVWMPQRERLLQNVLDGLRSTKVKELVKQKLETWFPGQKYWARKSIYDSITNWPKTYETLDCLLKGLYDEENSIKRATAKALVRIAAGDPEIGKKLVTMERESCDQMICAVVIETLLLGWPTHAELDGILKAARSSMSPELRLISIISLIQNQKQSEKDQEELFMLGSWAAGVSYEWRNDVAEALMTGWPKSTTTKKICLQQVKRCERDDLKLESEMALRILLEGYPQDQDVVAFLISEIKCEKYPFSMDSTQAWRLMANNFKDNLALVAAIDEWLPTQEHNEPEVSLATLVGRTPTGKKMLLSMLGSQRWIQWPAAALFEGWGMQDEEVAKALRSIAYADAVKSSWIGHFLPKIIEDKTTCRNRLLELLRNPLCDRCSFVMSGLTSLEGGQNDIEIVDIILDKLSKNNLRPMEKDDVINRLIIDYSADSRVRDLAKQELSRNGGNISAVAVAYGNDEEIRQMIIKALNPLPVALRGIIAKQLGGGIGDNEYIISLLKNYDLEENGSVKTISSISYYTLLNKSDIDQSESTEYLSKSIVCYGPDHKERRQAAFCGIVLLNRIDLMINAKETIGADRICSISMGDRSLPNVPLTRFVLQHWDKIKASFGDEFYSRIYRGDHDLLTFWDTCCPFADEYPSPRDEAIRFFEERKERTAKPEILRFLGRVKPKSSLLLEYCLPALSKKDNHYNFDDNTVVASELLGVNFAGDNDILTLIVKDAKEYPYYGGIIIALCEGWPDSDALEQIYKWACQHTSWSPHYYVYFQLICQKSHSNVIIKALKRILSETIIRKRNIIRPIVRRLKADDVLTDLLIEILQNKPTPSEKSTIPKLISTSRGVSPELREWITEEVQNQLSGTEPHEVGVDLFVGEMRPVIHSLMDVIDQTNRLVEI
ncbi:MAG: NACHT domain-containing protein [Deltaproteobacteria bacterium]